MPKARSIYACTECGSQQSRWLGRCPDCGRWDSLVEESLASARHEPQAEPLASAAKPVALGEIEADALPRLSSGVPELDRVLGGG
ncbi:MAG: DNA repair protein RadA, partial [Myxococcota bacterium]